MVCKWLKDGKELELIARIRVAQRYGPEGTNDTKIFKCSLDFDFYQ